MSLRRLPNWPELLADEIVASNDKPFVRGEMDCALFVCDCVLAMTGEDVAKRFRGKYKTRRGAMQQIRRQGYADLYALLVGTFGEPLQSVRLAQRGDVVFIDTVSDAVMGIVDLDGRHFVATGTEGLQRHPIELANHAWRVGG